MASRRRTGALAGAIDLAGQLFLQHRQQETERAQRAQEMALRFKQELALMQARAGQETANPFTGETIPGVESAQFPSPSEVAPGQTFSRKLPGGINETVRGITPKKQFPTISSALSQIPTAPGRIKFEETDEGMQAVPTELLDLPLQVGSTESTNIPSKAILSRALNLINPLAGLSGAFSAKPQTVQEPIEGEQTGRQELSAIASAIQRDPSVINRIPNLLSIPDLAPFRPQLEQLAGSVRESGIVSEKDVSDLPDGTILEDDQTGERFQVVNGKLQPI